MNFVCPIFWSDIFIEKATKMALQDCMPISVCKMLNSDTWRMCYVSINLTSRENRRKEEWLKWVTVPIWYGRMVIIVITKGEYDILNNVYFTYHNTLSQVHSKKQDNSLWHTLRLLRLQSIKPQPKHEPVHFQQTDTLSLCGSFSKWMNWQGTSPLNPVG